jgi:tetratricopeptide (TPR) repeat protein
LGEISWDQDKLDEAIALWLEEAAFRCSEQARLFAALARDVGLDAFYVDVERDCYDEPVLHACAAVFHNGKAWLVDPSYYWFGVVHKQFKVCDDLQAIANYFHQKDDIPLCRVAAKLQPNSAEVQFILAGELMKNDQLPEARKVLDIALRLDSESWQAHYSRGAWAGRNSDWAAATEWLRKSAALNPGHAHTHFLLAIALRNLDRLKEARDEFRLALSAEAGLNREHTEAARQYLAELNERLGAD